MPIEIEDKLDVEPDIGMPDLGDLDGVRATDVVTHVLEARYHDTAALTLARAGITLRHRAGGSDDGWHLKLPVRDGVRHEVRLEASGAEDTEGADGAVPERLRTVLAGTIGEEALAPVAVVRTERTATRLLDDQGRVLAEIADDRVVAEVPDPDGAVTVTSWREWEVELVEGGDALLADAVARLTDAGARRAEHPSKLARVLGDRMPVDPPVPAPPQPAEDATAGGVVLARVTEQVAAIVRLDPLVRAEAPDAVHQMRVATRRLRSALSTFEPLLGGPVPDHVRAELKWLTGVLGEARDAEVLRRRLLAAVDELPDAAIRGDARRVIDEGLENDHRDALAGAADAMSSPRYTALREALLRLVTDPPWTELGSRPAAEVLPDRLHREWRRLRKRVRRLEDAQDDEATDVALHEVRKAAKRARYAGEAVVPVWGKRAKRFAKRAKALQTVLGEHQDTVVARDRLHRLADEVVAAGGDAFTLGALHARESDRAAAARDALPLAWRRMRRRKVRAWLR